MRKSEAVFELLRRYLLVAGVIGLFVLTSCGGDDKGEPKPAAPTVTAPLQASVEVGNSISFTFSFAAPGGFKSGSVTANGGTATITADGTAGSTSGEIVVSFTAGTTAGQGDVKLTVTDNENQSGNATATVSISVVTKIVADPATTYQEMIGFGGALTWYSTLVTNSSKKEEMADLMFNDLGIDILRLKTWYYPDNYPDNKDVSSMSDKPDNDYAKQHWDATNEFYELAKARNPDVKILLSSWGPPPSLKDNDHLRQGTLKKEGGAYMYDAFAEYWNDILEYTPFDPDYISIQNEPTYVNAGWTTCQWAINETPSLAGYNTAFNKVYDKIKTRTHVPVMVGPESQDVPTFVTFANVLKDNPNCGVFGYHPYNINAGTQPSAITTSLQSVGAFTTKPILMTEFADNLNWFNTALFIQNALINANTSGYIYWKLAWLTPTSGEDAAMIGVVSNGNSYTATPFYYLIKHFAKEIDAGYKRIGVTSPSSSLSVTAFVNPDGNKVTFVIVNSGSATSFGVDVKDKTITSIAVDQSTQTNLYKRLDNQDASQPINLPSQSITTVVLGI